MNTEASSFDLTSFLDAATTEAFTRRPPLPVGDYVAIVGEITVKNGEIKKGDRAGQPYVALNVPLEVDLSSYPDALGTVGQPKVTLYHMVMLDTKPGGGLDNGPGKNNNLRRYRESLDLNTPGTPFAPRMMQGRPIRVKVKHDLYEGEIQERVDGVSKV